ncbi:MAG: hypothetical protein DI598_09260 [Pseudopedobacter saltans]|uniref:Uncharacterized protein n=1 Tax=Pseudopedobacter saltans TaxID=151895 RepID=A0A2W5F4T1_9SPHI|nr:MAG: hypothetical protein DI598_09260 [Pseudopedobacter saltans]
MRNIYMGLIIPSIVLFPIIIALYNRKYWLVFVRMVFFYLLFSLFFIVFSLVTNNLYINNLPILHLYTVLEFIIICMLFRSFTEKKKDHYFFTYLAFLFVLFAIAYVVLTNSLYRFNTWPRFIGSLIIVFCCIYFLIKELVNEKKEKLTFKTIILFGLMLYFSSSSILFGMSQLLIGKSSAFTLLVWNIHATILAIMYLMFAWAFLQLKKEK